MCFTEINLVLSFCESHFMDDSLIVHLLYMHITESTPTKHNVIYFCSRSYMFKCDIKPFMLHILSLWMVSLMLSIQRICFRRCA